MHTAENQVNKLAALISVALWATAEALAQENLARPARRIVVSIPDRKLAVPEAGQVVKVFETAVGAPYTPSPTGEFTIVQRIPDPTWYAKGKIVPPGKSNPLGPRWLGLSKKGYGIHGTNNPASHGCIRLRNRDIEELFEMVSVGDEVDPHGERPPKRDRIFDQPMTAGVAVVGQ